MKTETEVREMFGIALLMNVQMHVTFRVPSAVRQVLDDRDRRSTISAQSSVPSRSLHALLGPARLSISLERSLSPFKLGRRDSFAKCARSSGPFHP